jgi:hypothetical protein
MTKQSGKTAKPDDVCACGDYRHQHDEQGCKICRNSLWAYEGCTKFKLAGGKRP